MLLAYTILLAFVRPEESGPCCLKHTELQYDRLINLINRKINYPFRSVCWSSPLYPVFYRGFGLNSLIRFCCGLKLTWTSIALLKNMISTKKKVVKIMHLSLCVGGGGAWDLQIMVE